MLEMKKTAYTEYFANVIEHFGCSPIEINLCSVLFF